MTEEIKNSRSLYQALWNCADELRSKMDANEYKSYLLGIVFYKYLSDKMLYYISEVLEEPTHDLDKAQKLFEDSWQDDETREDLIAILNDEIGYIVEPALSFTALVNQANMGEFQLESLAQGFRNIEQSNEIFEDMFEDIDLYSRKLGANNQKQNATIAKIMKELSNINLADHDGDILGDAYEYLIGQFASDSGKKAGEFYTPQPVSQLMTRIVMHGREDKRDFTVYDPTMGFRVIIMTTANSNDGNGLSSLILERQNTNWCAI